jgi:hypothetical protein
MRSYWFGMGLLCALAACKPAVTEVAPVADALTRLEQACVSDMVKNTCSVMTGPQASQTTGVVFIAGVGAVDGNAYRELKASGEAMCTTVRQACERDWNASQCQVARSLWAQNASPNAAQSTAATAPPR